MFDEHRWHIIIHELVMLSICCRLSYQAYIGKYKHGTTLESFSPKNITSPWGWNEFEDSRVNLQKTALVKIILAMQQTLIK